MDAVGLTGNIGTIVHYYSSGWRYGHLEKVKGIIASVRPIAAYKATRPNLIRIPVADIEDDATSPYIHVPLSGRRKR